MTTMLTGIQPTGTGIPHLGNYIGAIRNFNSIDADTKLFMIADQHSTTVEYNPETLQENCVKTFSMLKACNVEGLIYRQSGVPEHSMLSQILTHMMSLGPLERMTQFKDKTSKYSGGNQAIPLGLLTYPVLMAADILLYNTDIVPVGDDQHQHLQLTAELAKRFNNFAKTDFFTSPRMHIMSASRIMSLDNPLKKMSKSGNASGVIYLDEDMSAVSKKYKKAVSDSDLIDMNYENRPGLRNLLQIMSSMTGEDIKVLAEKYTGKGFGALKKDLIETHEAVIFPITQRYHNIIGQNVREQLLANATSAREMASENIRKIYKISGLEYNNPMDIINSILETEDDAKKYGLVDEMFHALRAATKGNNIEARHYFLTLLSNMSEM